MKIKVIDKSLEDVLKIERKKHKRPIKPKMFFRTLMRVVAAPDLRKTNFRFERVGMEKLSKG